MATGHCKESQIRKLRSIFETLLAGGFIPAGALIPDRYEIPYFDPRTKKGYQRQPQAARINQLANDLKKERVDLPTAILLNLRNRDARLALVDGHLDLETLFRGAALSVRPKTS